MPDAVPITFRARGPVEVAGVRGDLTPVVIPPGRRLLSQVYWLAAVFAALAAGGMASLPAAGSVALLAVGLPFVWRWLTSRSIRADRSGLTVDGERWPWEDVRSVEADVIRWRIEDSSGRHRETVEHAVVVTRTDGERWAFWMDEADDAQRVAEHLALLARFQSGTEDDVPEAIRGLAARETQKRRVE
jgi:hypothetical protein